VKRKLPSCYANLFMNVPWKSPKVAYLCVSMESTVGLECLFRHVWPYCTHNAWESQRFCCSQGGNGMQEFVVVVSERSPTPKRQMKMWVNDPDRKAYSRSTETLRI
jgi:hypothetical protein